ncbi:hypothetical protein H105_04130, partial [Trichophyton soudanense CBS 452.61]
MRRGDEREDEREEVSNTKTQRTQARVRLKKKKLVKERDRKEKRLCDPEPYLLEDVSGDLLWPLDGVHGGLSGEDIRFGGRDPAGALENLPEDEEGEVEGDADVGGEEGLEAEGLEGVEAVEEDDDGEEDEGDPCEIGLEGRLEEEGVAVDALGLESGVEADVGDQHADPVEERGDGCQVLEPDEDLGRAGGGSHEGQEGDGCSDADGIDWHAPEDAVSYRTQRPQTKAK